MPRSILHVDMDAFFASVEMLDNPELRGKPLIVAGKSEMHGVVSAASYEARAFGIKSAMPTATAMRLCKNLIRVPGRHGRYSELSHQIFELVGKFTPQIEVVSVDEAYLDVTGSEKLFGDAVNIAREIKKSIKREVGLSCSVGVASSKMVAKIASDFQKPDGLTIVPFGAEAKFLAPLSPRRMPGIGARASELLSELDIKTLGELASYPANALAGHLGSRAIILQERAVGIDHEPVSSQNTKAFRRGGSKQISCERTLHKFTRDRDKLHKHLLQMADDIATRLRKKRVLCRNVTLKLRDDKFDTFTRSATFSASTDISAEILQSAWALYEASPIREPRSVRLIGLGVSKLSPSDEGQMELLVDERREKTRELERTVDSIRKKMGSGAIKRATNLDKPNRQEPG